MRQGQRGRGQGDGQGAGQGEDQRQEEEEEEERMHQSHRIRRAERGVRREACGERRARKKRARERLIGAKYLKRNQLDLLLPHLTPGRLRWLPLVLHSHSTRTPHSLLLPRLDALLSALSQLPSLDIRLRGRIARLLQRLLLLLFLFVAGRGHRAGAHLLTVVPLEVGVRCCKFVVVVFVVRCRHRSLGAVAFLQLKTT